METRRRLAPGSRPEPAPPGILARVAQAQRVRDLAEDALARADAARHGLEDLLAAVERLRGELASNGDGPRTAGATATARVATVDEARLVALEMAMAGCGRDEVAAHLHGAYGGSDVGAVLADVFGV